MNITEKKVSELKESEYNPRHIDEAKLELLKKSITEDKEFLSVRPLIVNMYKGRENVVIGGNMRLRAAKELKLEKIPVIVVKVPLAKEKVWNLKDNASYGYWEPGMLRDLFIELKDDEDIDLDMTGFSTDEINALINEEIIPTEPDIPEDDKEFGPAKTTKIKLGDIISVGDHYIMCGDSTKKEDIEKLVNTISDAKPKLLVTSPPYGVGIEYEEKGIIPLKKLLTGFTEAYATVTNNMVINFANIRCATDGWQFDTYGFLNETMSKNGFHLLDTRIWRKPKNFGTAPYWLHTHKSIDDWEFINIYQKTKEHKDRLSKDENNDWGYSGVWEMTNASGEGYHPAKFPVILPFNAIKLLSDKGDVIIDPFGGSMTTLIACEQLKRRALMMELEPLYIEASLERLKKYFPDINIESSGEL
jgi:DNA modification methylase